MSRQLFGTDEQRLTAPTEILMVVGQLLLQTQSQYSGVIALQKNARQSMHCEEPTSHVPDEPQESPLQHPGVPGAPHVPPCAMQLQVWQSCPQTPPLHDCPGVHVQVRQLELSILQPPVQEGVPCWPALQVAPPRSPPSHSSLPSLTPLLLHPGCVPSHPLSSMVQFEVHRRVPVCPFGQDEPFEPKSLPSHCSSACFVPFPQVHAELLMVQSVLHVS